MCFAEDKISKHVGKHSGALFAFLAGTPPCILNDTGVPQNKKQNWKCIKSINFPIALEQNKGS